MFAMLEEWPRDDHEGSPPIWTRLEILLETHAEAEEKYFYPELLRSAPVARTPSPSTRRSRTPSRTTTTSASRCARSGAAAPGRTTWWTAVIDANVHNSDHMGEEERQDLADFRQRASLELRHEIAVQFLRYEAVRAAEGITPRDKDPEAYVEEKKTSQASATAEKAAGQGEEGGEDRARELRPRPRRRHPRPPRRSDPDGSGEVGARGERAAYVVVCRGAAGGDEARGRGVAG